jgi:hypothetical protein
MNYYILNTISNNYLSFPKTGIWCTQNIEIAKQMLDICLSYIEYLNIPNYNQYFIIDSKEISL